MHHFNNDRRTYLTLHGRRKTLIKYKVLQDTKERGGLDLPNLKLYFSACCLAWIKNVVIIKK